MAAKITSKITDVIKRDRKVMLTTTREPYPLVVERADSSYIYDIAGNRFIDFTSFIDVYNFGDDEAQIVRDAIKRQIDRVMHAAFTDFYAERPVRFAENLLTMFPSGFGRVFFSNSGSEANEAAIKFARLFTKRQYSIAFYNAFHGRTMGSLSLTSSKRVQREHFGPFNSAVHAPYAYCYRCPFGKEYPSCGVECVDYVKKYTLKKDVSPDEVAAIFIEPVQGEGGFIVPPPDFVKGIREIASDNNILLVDDEVQAGYMRTGKFLALSHFGVDADIYTMAKAIGGGLPMGVTVTRSSLGNIPEGAHSNTFGGNMAVVAGAEALLQHVKKNRAKFEHDARSKGKIVMKRLNEMKERYEIVGDVRGLGLMIGIELVKDKKTKEPATKEQKEILKRCFYNGLVLLPTGESGIRIVPTLTISSSVLERGLAILEDAIKSVNNKR